MSSQYFRCDEHVVPCQHIRTYYRATANSQEEELRLAVKQYTPLDNFAPNDGDITIIAAHSCGFAKELYQPLFDDLYFQSQQHHSKTRIRSIWIADVATHAASAQLNDAKLGLDYSWDDHARDLLSMINTLRHHMPRPLVGLGHSMGGHNILQLSLLHPRLFTTLVLIEPTTNMTPNGMNFAPVHWVTNRRDIWPSRAEAAADTRRLPLIKAWDQRCKDLWPAVAFRDLPTPIYPTAPPKVAAAAARAGTTPVTLATTKHHDARAYTRNAYPPRSQALSTFHPSHPTHPDLSKEQHAEMATPLYRPEPVLIGPMLPFVRPSAFFMYGALSKFPSAQGPNRAHKLNTTGSGPGGSGGAAAGRVAESVIEGGGHFVVFEMPGRVAGEAWGWIERELERWRREDQVEREAWAQVSGPEKEMLDDDWKYWVAWKYGPEKKGRNGAHVDAKI